MSRGQASLEKLFRTNRCGPRGKARRRPFGASAVWWTVAALLGGFGGISSTGTAQDLVPGQWTWVSGSNQPSQAGTYGTKGMAAPGNGPGARESGVSWTDSSGNLWLFGGSHPVPSPDSSTALNDLWKFDVSSGQWTWIGGSNQPDQAYQLGTYGTKGAAASGNVPGARFGAASWTDTGGNLWLFGGIGFAASLPRGELNDLWKFDVSTLQWTWVSGSNQPDQAATYGTQGVADPGNVPSGRALPASWADPGGNLWLFGGVDSGEGSGPWLRNDLWKFEVSSGQWTWVSGSMVLNQLGTYGTQGVAAAGNVPGARDGAVAWVDANGSLWLFGGIGIGVSGTYGSLNDLWKFATSTGEWTWVSGSNVVNQIGSYGTKGMASPGNAPMARYGASSWASATGNLWLFGGLGTGSVLLNDLWVYAKADGGAATCTPDSTSLCLLGDRFRVAVDYGDYGGGHGQGKAVSLTPDTGYFWFSSASNVEVVAKMVSFCGNGSNNVAVYAGGLTDLDVTLHVTDTRTGTGREYHNPLGTGFSLVRDGPFDCPAGVTPSLEHAIASDAHDRIVETTPWPGGPIVRASCTPDPSTLCLLNGRFQVRAAYRDYSGGTGTGRAVPLTSDTGTFWFFDAKNVEVVTKMVSFCAGGSNNIGIYSGGLTDLEVTLTVADTLTGLTKTYANPLGTPFELIRDGPFSCP